MRYVGNIESSVKGQWFFRIRATNGRILARSETYRNRADAAAGAGLVKRWAPPAQLSTSRPEPLPLPDDVGA